MECPHCKKNINIGGLIGKESWKNMTYEERAKRARNAALARWHEVKEPKKAKKIKKQNQI